MTNEEFIAKYSGAPLSIEELGLLAEKECQDDLGSIASAYIDALTWFRERLMDYDFEQD